MKRPTELQLRVLAAVDRGETSSQMTDRGHGIHGSAQVASRAITLCLRAGWIRWVNHRLRLTAAGRQALSKGGAEAVDRAIEEIGGAP